MQLAAARSRRRRIVDLHHGAIRNRPRDVAIETARVMSRSKPEIMVQSAKTAPCTMIGSTAFKTSAAGRLAQMGHAAHHRGVWLKGGRPWRSCAA
jgi:hypothetical protein